MLNLLRHFSTDLDLRLSLLPSLGHSASSKTFRRSPRQKGFFQRLFEVDGRWPEPPTDVELPRSDVEPPQPTEVQDKSEQIAELMQRGAARLEEQDFAGARDCYQQVLQLQPDQADACQYLAEILAQQGDLETAATYYRRAIDLANDLAQQSQPNGSTADLSESRQPEPSKQQSESRSACRTKQTELPWFEQVSFYLQQAMVSCNAGDWSEAHTACQTAIQQLEPEASMAYLLLGRSLQGQRQLAAAEQAYRKALMLQPNQAEAYARLGSLYAEQQRWSDAAQQYQTAVQLDPNFAGAYWKLAEVWQQLQQEDQAVLCWSKAFQLQPTWADAATCYRLAHRLVRVGQFEQAQVYFRRAIQQNAALAEAYLELGQLLHQQGDHQTAADCYRQGLRHCPDALDLYHQLGDELVTLQHWQEALIYYQQLLKASPDCIEAISGLYTCYSQLEQWEAALVYAQKRVEQQPAVAHHWHQLGDNFSRLNRWQEAIPAYERAIGLDPTFSWSHNNLADALLHLEQWQVAVNPLRTAIVLNPDFVWSHHNLGEALAHLEDWDGAIDAYRSALALQPDLPHTAGRLADMLQRRAVMDRTNAFAYYQKAIQQNPTEPDHYYKALELQPNSVDLYLGLTEALLAQERLDEAVTCCQIARQLDPEDDRVIARLKDLFQLQRQKRQPRFGNQQDYERWMERYTPTAEMLKQMTVTAQSWLYQPVVSIVMPVYNPPLAFLRAAIESVLAQAYPHWELCIADDASDDLEVLELLSQFAAQDSRIKVTFRERNGHISAASNSALELARGEYIALLDQDDLLAPEALYEVVALLNQHPQADLIYSDEDKLNDQGQRVQPFFKPDWCPDSFLSRMYTCHLGVYRRSLVEAIGGFRTGFEGSQDYDLVLRLTEQTQQIFHLPRVLYHWRHHASSAASSTTAKPYAATAAQRALLEACQRRGEPAREVVVNPETPGVYLVRYQLQHHPLVSIIIPTRNLGSVLDQCLQSIFEKTTYPHYEVILIDNGSDELETLQLIADWETRQPDRLKCYSLNIPFNYSQINNLAVSEAAGDHLLFLNNDIEVIAPDWIEAMVEQAQRPSVGAVGALLLYPDQTVQHAGVVLGIGGVAGHSHKYFPNGQTGYFSQLAAVNNYSAVTGACLMCRREVFEQVGGFDESLAIAFNDVDLCLRIRQAGYNNLSLPHARLYHHESRSRGTEDTPEKRSRFYYELDYMKQKWADLLQQDPCYSPHLSLEREDYSIRL
jgi:O-antigen biosynthesis protein